MFVAKGNVEILAAVVAHSFPSTETVRHPLATKSDSVSVCGPEVALYIRHLHCLKSRENTMVVIFRPTAIMSVKQLAIVAALNEYSSMKQRESRPLYAPCEASDCRYRQCRHLYSANCEISYKDNHCAHLYHCKISIRKCHSRL